MDTFGENGWQNQTPDNPPRGNQPQKPPCRRTCVAVSINLFGAQSVAVRGRARMSVGLAEIPVINPEDLVITKLIAGYPGA